MWSLIRFHPRRRHYSRYSQPNVSGFSQHYCNLCQRLALWVGDELDCHLSRVGEDGGLPVPPGVGHDSGYVGQGEGSLLGVGDGVGEGGGLLVAVCFGEGYCYFGEGGCLLLGVGDRGGRGLSFVRRGRALVMLSRLGPGSGDVGQRG